MTQRFFRTDRATYEAMRVALDRELGFPSARAASCFRAADQSPRDKHGRVFVAVPADWCRHPAAVKRLPALLASGAVVEISEPGYRAITEAGGP